MHSKHDPVSEELRNIEKDVDTFYLTNNLMKRNFAQSAWSLLAIGEDWAMQDFIRQNIPSAQDMVFQASVLVDALNYPMYWLYKTCNHDSKPPTLFNDNDDDYQSAVELFNLARSYMGFVTAYTYASRGLVELHLEDTTIYPSDPVFTTWNIEAYNFMIKSMRFSHNLDYEKFPRDELLNSVKVKGSRFDYKINPKIISKVTDFLEPLILGRFSLPDDWAFSKFTLGEFKEVYKSIFAICFIRSIVRPMAAMQGCIGLGINDSIIMLKFEDLIRMVCRYSDVEMEQVSSILEYLTYGRNDIKKPDPALQPIIQYDKEHFLLSPSLWTSLAAERNLTVLLNKLPTEQSLYSKLVNEKEDLMRKKILSSIDDTKIRIEKGTIPGRSDLGDIDLAIINDKEELLLLIELKWFIEPTEPREILEKIEELKRGIDQLKKLKRSIDHNEKQLLNKLVIDKDYKCNVALVSANWIGIGELHTENVPIIQEDHFIKKLTSNCMLLDLIQWLTQGLYLPKINDDFEVLEAEYQIGKWKLKWFELSPLEKGVFFPI